MPFQSEFDSKTTLTIIPYSRKDLYIKGIVCPIIVYIAIDLCVGLFSFLGGGDHHLLFSFKTILGRFNYTYQVYRDNPTNFIGLMLWVMFLILLVVMGIFCIRWIDILALIFPPRKFEVHNYPHLVVLSRQGIEIHTKKNNQEVKEYFAWRKEIFAVFVTMGGSDYKLRICLSHKPIPSQELDGNPPQEYCCIPKDSIWQVRLERLFMTKKDRKLAMITLRIYLRKNISDISFNYGDIER